MKLFVLSKEFPDNKQLKRKADVSTRPLRSDHQPAKNFLLQIKGLAVQDKQKDLIVGKLKKGHSS
jgi:hypothetical protein